MVRAALAAIIFTGGSAGSVGATCGGSDLFPRLQASAPNVFAEIEAEARAMPFGRGTLFRVSRNGAASHVFGTLHLADPRVVTYAPSVLAALRESRLLVLELGKPGAGRGGRAEVSPKLLLARPGRKPDHLLLPDEMTRLDRLAADRGLAPGATGAFGAGVLALMLDLPSCAASRGGQPPYSELVLARLAQEQGLALDGLETTEEQVNALSGLTREVERDLLVAAIRQGEQAADVIETSTSRYVAGDTGALVAWMRSREPLPSIPESRLPPPFLDQLLDVRSRRMRDRALPHLARGGAFVAVGAAHLPGRSGLLNLLSESGFRVEPIE